MASFISERLSIEGRSLRRKLTIITLLIFVLPFSLIGYVLYEQDVFSKLDSLSLIIFALLLVLILAGVLILRQIFDKFIMIMLFMKKAESGGITEIDMQTGAGEFKDMVDSFNKMARKLEETSKLLDEQTVELKREMAERKQAEDALRESEGRYKKLFDSLNDYIKTKMSERHP